MLFLLFGLAYTYEAVRLLSLTRLLEQQTNMHINSGTSMKTSKQLFLALHKPDLPI